jgi:hypothetical protein
MRDILAEVFKTINLRIKDETQTRYQRPAAAGLSVFHIGKNIGK